MAKEVKKNEQKNKEPKQKKNIVEKLEDIKDNIEDKVEDIKDKIEDMGDDLEDKIEDKLDDVKEDVEDKIEQAKKQQKVKKALKIINDNKVVILVAIIAILSIVIYNIATPSKGERLVLSAENTLKSITKKQDINLVEYTYNAVATKQVKKEIRYYVAYEGKVKAGIAFEKVGIRVNENKKKIIISIPEPKITAFTVVDNKFEYIFTKDKYQKEDMKNEVYELCEKDLEKRVNKDPLLLETARENAITTMKSFYEPWLEKMDEDYTLEVEIQEEK